MSLTQKRPVQPAAAPAPAAIPPNAIYSQPANTGTGTQVHTQVYYAVENLKKKQTPHTWADICSFLSLHTIAQGEDFRNNVRRALQNHPKVAYDPRGADRKGTFVFKPPYDIRNSEQLLAHLQAQKTAQGLSVKELREGWPDCEVEITKLEKEHKLLVTRNRKDDHAKQVWADDPTLFNPIDDEFRNLWDKTRLPDALTVVEEIEKAGLTPTGKSGAIKPKVVKAEKKTKKPRRGGKMTNTHMTHILRDYSHLKK